MIADEKQAYVLTDEGSYLNFKDKVDLVPLVSGGLPLRNPYAAIVVNRQKHPAVNARLAHALVDFLISAELVIDVVLPPDVSQIEFDNGLQVTLLSGTRATM